MKKLLRLTILSCCALGGFAFGRWVSTPAAAPAVALPVAAAPVAAPINLPLPERAGRVSSDELYRSLLATTAEDRAAYLGSLQKLPAGPDRRASLIAFFQCLASINPQAAADLVPLVGKDDLVRAAEAVIAATPAPYTSVLAKMLLDLPESVPSLWREEQLRGQMYFWAALDPAAAAQFAEQNQSAHPLIVGSRGITRGLAANDPAAAERWLQEHPELHEDAGAMEGYIEGLYQHDPALARHYLTEHATEDALQATLGTVALFTLLNSPSDAAEFVRGLPTKGARSAALASITDMNTEIFANKETSRTSIYAGVAQWVTKFPPEEWPKNMPDFLAQWRQVDPAGSVNWMAQLPSASRPTVAAQLIQRMSANQVSEVLAAAPSDFHHDILAAVAGGLPPDPDQRRAVLAELPFSPEDTAQVAAMAR